MGVTLLSSNVLTLLKYDKYSLLHTSMHSECGLLGSLQQKSYATYHTIFETTRSDICYKIIQAGTACTLHNIIMLSLSVARCVTMSGKLLHCHCSVALHLHVHDRGQHSYTPDNKIS